MKFLITLLFSFFICGASFAQYLSAKDKKFLRQKEDSMKVYAAKIINGIESSDRFKADSTFTRMLMRALKTPHSFYYRFDSLAKTDHCYQSLHKNYRHTLEPTRMDERQWQFHRGWSANSLL